MVTVETSGPPSVKPFSRRLVPLGGTLLAIIAIVATAYVTTSPVVTISPMEAQLNVVPAERLPPLPSIVSVPLTIPLSTLQEALERHVPPNEQGTRPDPIGDPVRDDVFTWNFTRSPIQLSVGNGAVNATTRISGAARVSGRVVLIRGDIGRLLGKLNPTNIPFSAHADLAADASVISRPIVQSNWRIAPGLSADVRLREAEIPILNVTRISVRGRLQPDLDAKVGTLVTQLNGRLANDDFLERAAAKAWADLCKAHPVEGPKGTDGISQPLFLVVRPRTAHLGPLVVTADNITTTLGITAETMLTDVAPTALVCPPLPENILPPPDQGFQLVVPVDLSYRVLSAELTRSLVGRSYATNDDQLAVTVTSMTLAGDGDRLRFTVGFEAAERRFFGARLRGDVYLRARPVVDAERQVISFNDVAMTAESQDALNAAGALAKLIGPIVEARLTKSASIDLAREATRAREKAEAALRSAAERKLGGLSLTKGEISDLRLERVGVGPTGLSALATARGVLAVDVIEARFR